MLRDWRLYLDDIVESAGRVLEYTSGMMFEQFLADRRTYDAVLRNLEIIGEAVKKLPTEVRALAPAIPWGSIAGFRDRLAHGYFDLDNRVIWGAVRDGVSPLRDAAQRILADAGDAPFL